MSQAKIKSLEKDLGFKLQKKTSYSEFNESVCYLYIDNKVVGVNLRNSKLTYLPKAISGIETIELLNLSDNQISDIQHIAKVKNLSCIYLNNNPLLDHSPITRLPSLKQLYVNNAGVKD